MCKEILCVLPDTYFLLELVLFSRFFLTKGRRRSKQLEAISRSVSVSRPSTRWKGSKAFEGSSWHWQCIESDWHENSNHYAA